jgi:hypothetical protein
MQKLTMTRYLAGCAVAAFAASASPSNANIITYNFAGPFGSLGATEAVTSGGLTVNVTATNSTPGLSLIVQTGGGYGVATPGLSPSDQLQTDGIDPNEALIFSFSTPVRLRSITFAAIDNFPDGEDLVAVLGGSPIVLGLTFPGGPNIASMGTCTGDLSLETGVCTLDWTSVTPLDTSFNPVSTQQMSFAFGASEDDDNFLILSLTVEKVAEPATAALLLTGLLGSAFIARRRRK